MLLSQQPRGTGVSPVLLWLVWDRVGRGVSIMAVLGVGWGLPCAGPLLRAGHRMAQLKPLHSITEGVTSLSGSSRAEFWLVWLKGDHEQ